MDNNSNQTFIAEIYDFQSRKLLKNLTSKEPIFEIDKIRPGSQVEINLYRENKKGWNEATRFNAIIPSREKLAGRCNPLYSKYSCLLFTKTRKCNLNFFCRFKTLRSKII